MKKSSTEKLRAGEIYFDLLVLTLSTVVLILAYQISGFAISGAGTFPMASSAVMVGSMLLVIRGNLKKEKAHSDFFSEIRQTFTEVFTKNFLVYTFICILYVAAIEPIHFLPSSFVFITLSIIFLKGSTPFKAMLISTGTLAFIYVVFLYFFKVILP